MEQEFYFMPLGGGQRVGASCYYLRIGGVNLILDAGTGIERGLVFEPDLYPLFTLPFIQSVAQVNQIYISHAHADHVGYLLKLMGQADRSDVYMTEITKLLAEYQLYDRAFLNGAPEDESRRLAARYLFDRVTAVSYMQTLDFGSYKATFFPAGHIPGAMMILFECGKRKILYTADYSMEGTPLTDGCILPKGLKIDTLIMCGLHAKHPGYRKKADGLYKTVQYVLRLAGAKKRPVMCQVSQLSKGIEFIKTLNQYNTQGIPVYIDRSILKVVEKMEQLAVPVMDANDRVMTERIPLGPHIYVTAEGEGRGREVYEQVRVDFSLHEDFSGMMETIRAVDPKLAVLVHCAKAYAPQDLTIEQVMMRDGECRTQFIFAKEKELYRL